MNIFEFLLTILAVGFVVTVVVVVLVVFGIRKLVRWIRSDRPTAASAFQPLDENNASPEAITSVLKRYSHERTIGNRARSGMTQVKSAAEKQAHLQSLLSGKFTQESLTWSKFSTAVDVAYHVLLRNCATLANRVQAFDLRDYRELDRLRSTAAIRRASGPSDVQMQRWNLLNGSLQEMDRIIAANEQMLLELDRFSNEMSRQGQAEIEASANGILEEIQQLSEQAKLYQ